MIIARQVKQKIETIPEGVVLGIKDFQVETQYEPTLVKVLNRLVKQGDLERLSKGKYYKPKRTMFGLLKPSASEIAKDLLERNGEIIGYITGTTAFAGMGLTTQIASSIVIGTNKYRRPIKRGEYTIRFLVQDNQITEKNIPLLRILDAIRLIREIPATTPDESIAVLQKTMSCLPKKEQDELVSLSKNYTPYVRALLGAILESIGADVNDLRNTLNGVTTYKLPISIQSLPTKNNWNIV